MYELHTSAVQASLDSDAQIGEKEDGGRSWGPGGVAGRKEKDDIVAASAVRGVAPKRRKRKERVGLVHINITVFLARDLMVAS